MSILMISKALESTSEMLEILHKEQGLILVLQKRISVIFGIYQIGKKSSQIALKKMLLSFIIQVSL